MQKIKLTNVDFALVDNEDFSWLSQFKWCKKSAHSSFGVCRTTHATKPMSRTILEHYGALLTGLVVDHINHNPFDNQKYNLRICTDIENKRNL